MEQMKRPARYFIHPVRSMSDIIMQSGMVLARFEDQVRSVQPVYIITGDQGAGKTTFLNRTLELLEENGVPAAGIMARGIDHDGGREGFYLVDLESGRTMVLCTTSGPPEWPVTGKYHFDPGTITEGEKILSSIPKTHIAVVDEVGPLEMQGGGWDRGLKNLVDRHPAPMIWIVRRSIIRQVIRKYALVNVLIVDITRFKPFELVAMIMRKERQAG
jgi:nucleoside-triphosphatase THEP1